VSYPGFAVMGLFKQLMIVQSPAQRKGYAYVVDVF
jgi:hypothetical protein